MLSRHRSRCRGFVNFKDGGSRANKRRSLANYRTCRIDSSVTGRASNFRGTLDNASVNLRYRDGEINERTSSLLLSSLLFANHPSCLLIHASPCWSLSVHLMLRQNSKTSCLCADHEDSPCRYQVFIWERMLRLGLWHRYNAVP